MNHTRTPPPIIYEVSLDDGTSWTGTKRELMETHPDWRRYARKAQRSGGGERRPEHRASAYTNQAWQRPRQREQAIIQPAHDRGFRPEDTMYGTGDAVLDVEGGEDQFSLQRSHTSVVRYDQPLPPRRRGDDFHPNPVPHGRRRAHAEPAMAVPGYTEEWQATHREQRRGSYALHPLVYVGIGMIAMLALWVAGQMAVTWWQNQQNNATYGRPRIYQLDSVFGHRDSAANPTHLIIINLNRHVMIIELPGGDSTHARIYTGPTLIQDGGDLVPVTGEAIDVNGDGKRDLVLFIQNQRVVFMNDGTQFRPLKPGERVTVLH